MVVFTIFTIGVYQFLCLISSIANAGNVSDALDKKFKAQNEYYLQVKKLGPNATPQQELEVRNRTITPASQGFNKAIRSQMQTIVKDTELAAYKDSTKNSLKSLPEKILKLWKEKLFPSGKKQPSAPSGVNAPPLAPPQQDAPNQSPPREREQIVLDGSKIPKEITFPGTRKSGNLTPDETSGNTPEDLQVRGDIQLDVIEFKPGPKPSTTPLGPLNPLEKYPKKK
jgi:hypothetical protein